MKINWKIIDKMLLGEADTDDLPIQAKEEVHEFVQTHNWEVFSEETLELLSGIWDLAMRPAYEAQTNERIPNIFHSLLVEKEETEDGERETLSSGDTGE